jgi:hypothetical protein
MTESLTSSQIQTRLEDDIARHPGCRDFRIEVSVRRVDQGDAPLGDWSADFLATGAANSREACEEALLDILASARQDYSLSLDS